MEKLTGMLSSSSCLTAFVVLSVHRRDDGEDLGTRRQTNVGLMMRTPLSVYDDEELHRTRASLQAGQFSASEKKIDLLRQGVRPEKKEKKTRRRYHPLRPDCDHAHAVQRALRLQHQILKCCLYFSFIS